MFDSFEKENKTKTFIFYLKNSMTRESSGQIYMQEENQSWKTPNSKLRSTSNDLPILTGVPYWQQETGPSLSLVTLSNSFDPDMTEVGKSMCLF